MIGNDPQGKYLGLNQVGIKSVFVKNITDPANNGITLLGTISIQPCQVKTITIFAITGQTLDLTSAAVKAGNSRVLELIPASTALQSHLDAIDKQISWTGTIYLPAGGTIITDLQGVGATAVNLKYVIEYEPIGNGGLIS